MPTTIGLNSFQKCFFKLLSNSMLSKTLENVRNPRGRSLVTNDRELRKLDVKIVLQKLYHHSKGVS